METIPQKGSDRPSLRDLYRHVLMEITSIWHDVGIELLETEEVKLRVMLDKYGSNSKEATKEMLQLWLDRKSDASWNQLIQALKVPYIGLHHIAHELEEKLSIGGDDIEQFQPATKKQRSDQDFKANDYADDVSEEVDFTKHGNNVGEAFIQLLTIFQRESAFLHFPSIKTSCIASARDNLKPKMCKVKSHDELFNLLASNELYCNWMRIRFFKAIVVATKSRKLEGILNKYKDAFFSKTLSELWDFLPHIQVRSKYYDKVKATFNGKDPEKITVKEFEEYCAPLVTTDLDDLIIEIHHKCLSITWLVPTDKVYKLFLSSLIVPQESRQDDYLEIGAWVVYHPQSVLEKLKIDFGMASPSTLLIGYYHGVLVRDINADSLADDMCSEKLLSSCDRNLISIAHSVHHRNWLILEYVRHVDANIFLAFCKLVSKSWPGIGLQLCTVSATMFQPEVQDLHVDSADFMEAQAMSPAQYLYYKSPLVHIAFLCLIDQVRELLQFCDITIFIKECENIMASEQENIKLFCSHMIVKLSKCSSTLTLLWCLSCFFTWCNHSILRLLLIKCKSEAVQLLDEFDSRFDPLQSIASYPIPYFSSDMIPDDSSEYTILTIRCDQELYKSTLQYVYDMQALIIEKCNITQHCLQLLAVRSNPTMLYWTIPKCVVKIISDQIPKHSEYLYTKGVLEVLVYPEPLLSMGDDVILGTLAFIAESQSNNEEVITFIKQDDTQECHKSYKALQESREYLKADNIKLKAQLEDFERSLQIKESQKLCNNCKVLQERMTNIKLENNKLKKQLKLKLENKDDSSQQAYDTKISQYIEETAETEFIEEITDTQGQSIEDTAETKGQEVAKIELPDKVPATVKGAVVIDQIVDKNERPLMGDLNRYVIRKYDGDWEDIGIELGLELDVLKIIGKDNPLQSIACLRETLDKWLKLNTDDATWKTLEVALTNVNRAKLGLDPVDDVYATLPAVVIELFDDLRDNYKIDRQRPHEDEWPPDQPSSIVNLALIHYKSTRTQQEVIEISKRCRESTSYVDKLASSLHSNVTTDIKKLFMPEASTNPPKRILIEGAPGIGKTVLSKEIAYQWANNELLQEHKLVFLMFLRDPKLHIIKSVKEILKLFTSEYSSDLYEFVKRYRGENVAFVFDGFDEYPVALQKESFITNLIKGENDGALFVNSTVVVTSRPTTTLFLHHIVDRRIEILGFPKEERDKYISLSLRDSLDKFQEIDKYLKQHTIINNLCYIPLHLAILMYLFQQDSLPETLTEMNEYFIISTIYRYLERHNLTPPGIVRALTDLPSSVVAFIYKLSQLAFTGLSNNQLVFTYEEIIKFCPEIDNIPGAINGFGLLQAVQHYPKKGPGRTTSVNFLHFTMQEYLAALHVSTLSSKKQLSLMEETFWVGQFKFMWIMYVGIVGVKSNTFASFVALNSASGHDNVYDKRKCLHLFQCYVEAKSVAELPETISSMFTDGKITLSGITLLPHHISSLIFFMFSSSIQQWKVLKLDHCNLREIGMNSLLEHVIKTDENISTLEYVDLSGNKSSPWGVYCAIIRHCIVSSLALCGDIGMKEYVNEITNSLQLNATLQSLTLCKMGKIGVQSIKDVLGSNTTLKGLNMSWKSKGTTIIQRKFTHDKISSTKFGLISHEGVVDINILYDGDHECSSEVICMSYKGIDDDAVCVMTFGLYNNLTVRKLDLSCNKITDDGVAFINDCFLSNCVLHTLTLSRNNISCKGAVKISELIYINKVIQKLDMSHNNISDDGAIAISESLKTNNTLQELNVSHNWITSEGAKKIAETILVNDGLYKLDMSHNAICDDGVVCISDSLKHNKTLAELNLSENRITNKVAVIIAEAIWVNVALQKLDLSCNSISDDRMIVISDALKNNKA